MSYACKRQKSVDRKVSTEECRRKSVDGKALAVNCQHRFVNTVLSTLLLLTLLLPLPTVLAEPVASGKVTLAIAGTDLITVLKDLAEQANLNIVASKNVTGKVTLFVKDVDLWDAFELILVSNELAYERQGDLLYIMPAREYELAYGRPYRDKRMAKAIPLRYATAAQAASALSQVKSPQGKVIVDEASNLVFLVETPELVGQMAAMVEAMDQPTESRTFLLDYAKAKDVAPRAQELVTKGRGLVQSDERVNALVVTDTPARLAQIQETIRTFDQRSRQVLIEAKIVQVSLSDKFQMGIDWQAVGRETINVKGLGALNLSSGGVLTLASSASRGNNYEILVEALRTFGETKILSEPKITAINGQEAKILVGSKEPFVTQTVSQTGTGTAVTAEQVTFLDVGVKLFVTPTIARDGYVQLKIRPEVSSKTGTLTTAQKNEIPIVETSEVETQLLVKDGQTIILGGLIKEEKARDHQRIPILGDIPILGLLFRSTKETTRRTGLLVFLTPRLTPES